MVGATGRAVNPRIPGGDARELERQLSVTIGVPVVEGAEPADAFIIPTLGGEGAIEMGGINSCSFTRKRHEGVEFATNKARHIYCPADYVGGVCLYFNCWQVKRRWRILVGGYIEN